MTVTAIAARDSSISDRRITRTRQALLSSIACAFVASVLPLVFRSSFASALMSQAAIAIVFALSYNMLFGQTGLLSFGHAVPMGLGGFCSAHAMRAVVAHDLNVPLAMIPLVGAAGGAIFGVAFGWLATRRSGTAFAMITLGFAELITASSSMLPALSGGEQGISVDRTALPPLFGFDFGSSLQVYYLTVVWVFLSTIAIYALTRTPLGRLANATRDNAERVAFNGFDPKIVRFLMYFFSSIFAGIAGALYVINYEIATSQSLGVHASGMVLVMTVIGGSGQFVGPAIGAGLITALEVMFGIYTDAWLLYLGLLFMLTVMFAPDGVSGLFVRHRRLLALRNLRVTSPALVLGAVACALVAFGIIVLVELSWRLSGLTDRSAVLKFGPFAVDAAQPSGWIVGLGILAAGYVGLLLSRPFIADSDELRRQWAPEPEHEAASAAAKCP